MNYFKNSSIFFIIFFCLLSCRNLLEDAESELLKCEEAYKTEDYYLFNEAYNNILEMTHKMEGSYPSQKIDSIEKIASGIKMLLNFKKESCWKEYIYVCPSNKTSIILINNWLNNKGIYARHYDSRLSKYNLMLFALNELDFEQIKWKNEKVVSDFIYKKETIEIQNNIHLSGIKTFGKITDSILTSYGNIIKSTLAKEIYEAEPTIINIYADDLLKSMAEAIDEHCKIKSLKIPRENFDVDFLYETLKSYTKNFKGNKTLIVGIDKKHPHNMDIRKLDIKLSNSTNSFILHQFSSDDIDNNLAKDTIGLNELRYIITYRIIKDFYRTETNYIWIGGGYCSGVDLYRTDIKMIIYDLKKDMKIKDLLIKGKTGAAPSNVRGCSYTYPPNYKQMEYYINKFL